jgi:pimeloyl-ACP methyl ester carboxylesterase
MRRWMAASLVFAVAVGLTSVEERRASAQPPGGAVAETFKTADGVELHGLFHATDKDPTKAPVVVFLYPPGANNDMTKGDWAGLAKELNKAGYHVFQFDWRGHGKSTSIKDKQKFWGNPYTGLGGTYFNGYIKGAPRGAVNPNAPLKNDIFFKDLGNNAVKYMPAYLNDLAAVRVHLDSKNDNKELNTSSIYLVGAGDAASLGLAWLTAEWNRPAVFPNVNQLGFGVAGYEYIPQPLNGGIPSEAGADFGGCVWLTATRPTSFKENIVKSWISNARLAPKIRENNPMLFLYAEKDTNGALSGAKQSAFFFNEVLVAAPRKGTNLEPLEQTFIKEVKGAAQLQGVKLLGQNATLKTEDTIVLYFAAIQKVRQKIPSKARKYDTPYFVDTLYFGLKP